MHQKKKLLIISNRYPAGPDDIASPFVHDFRLALERLDIAADVVTPYYKSRSEKSSYIDNSVHRFEWSDGSKVISQLPLYNPASFVKIKNYLLNGFKTAYELQEINRYDAVVALWAVPSGYIAWKLSEKYNIPYAVWALGSDINRWAELPFVGKIIRNVLKNADALFADGYELATKVHSLTDRVCRFIPSYHAIEINVKKPKTSNKQFISVGRIERSKGVFDLLDAFQIFLATHPDWRLYYVGTGRAEKALAEAIRRCSLGRSVTIAGYLPREEINSLMINSAAAIIPSHSDSLPLTFGEAMQAELPVICSDVGDMPYFIENYNVGYRFPTGDVEKLAESMSRMAEKGRSFSQNCSQALEELDIANSAEVVSGWLDALTPSTETLRFTGANS